MLSFAHSQDLPPPSLGAASAKACAESVGRIEGPRHALASVQMGSERASAILEDYLIQFTGFFIATITALVVGKVVLVAEVMPLLRRVDGELLAKPILFRTVV